MIDFYDYSKLWYYMEWRVDMMALGAEMQVMPQTKQAHTITSFCASHQGK